MLYNKLFHCLLNLLGFSLLIATLHCRNLVKVNVNLLEQTPFLHSSYIPVQIQPVSNESMLSSFLWLMRRTYCGIGTFSPLQGTAEAV